MQVLCFGFAETTALAHATKKGSTSMALLPASHHTHSKVNYCRSCSPASDMVNLARKCGYYASAAQLILFTQTMFDLHKPW
jgi:hypothetical protein